MVLFCASTVVCLPSPYILGLHLWLVYNTQSRFALVNLPQFPSDKTPSSFYPPPFRLQPHHPAEPLTPPSIVEGYLQVDMVGTDRWRKQLTRIWKLLTLVLVASTSVATRMKALLKFLQPNKVPRIPTGSRKSNLKVNDVELPGRPIYRVGCQLCRVRYVDNNSHIYLCQLWEYMFSVRM